MATTRKYTMTPEQADAFEKIFQKEREARGWTKSEAAEQLGVNLSLISTLEHGVGEGISFVGVSRAADGYGVPLVRPARALGFKGGPDEIPLYLADIVEDLKKVPPEKIATVRQVLRTLLEEEAF